MNTSNLFSGNINLLHKVLDLRAKNQKIIGSNIANADTPGYSAARFEFENELRHAVDGGKSTLLTTHSQHFPTQAASLAQVQGTIIRKTDETGIGDENSVSVDTEMIALSKNQLLYETAVQLLKKKLSVLKYAVQDGK